VAWLERMQGFLAVFVDRPSTAATELLAQLAPRVTPDGVGPAHPSLTLQLYAATKQYAATGKRAGKHFFRSALTLALARTLARGMVAMQVACGGQAAATAAGRCPGARGGVCPRRLPHSTPAHNAINIAARGAYH